MTSLRDLDASILLEACELFFRQKLSTTEISERIEAELRRTGSEFEMTREKVYDLIRESRRRGFFQILPPQQVALRERLEARYGEGFHVAHITDLGHLATAAAEVVAELIAKLHKTGREEVHLGLGAGKTSMLVAQHLAVRLRAAERLPRLVIHALTSGFSVTQPHTAPVSFFGFFEAVPTEISYVGLFASPCVETRDYESTRQATGVKESFDAADQIDIVLTALGSPSHGHGDFYRFMQSGSPQGFRSLVRAGWIGDVQYRPYSVAGPLVLDTKVRAVTLFELEDLVRLARTPERHVVLIAGPCSDADCRRTRPDAIRPLLVEPRLKVWNTIVTDVATARELVEDSSG